MATNNSGLVLSKINEYTATKKLWGGVATKIDENFEAIKQGVYTKSEVYEKNETYSKTEIDTMVGSIDALLDELNGETPNNK